LVAVDSDGPDRIFPLAVAPFDDKVAIAHRRIAHYREVDVLVVNEVEIVGIECKSKLSVDDVNEHLERLAKLKRLLPSYADKRVLGAVAAMVIDDSVAQYAYRKGLYVIGQSGDHLEIRNAEDFVAKAW